MSASGSTDRRAVAPIVVALVALVSVVAWAASLRSSAFSYDDAEAIRGNPVVEGTLPMRSAFTRDYWHHVGDAGHYRPLASLSLRLDRALWGEDARGFHLTNVVLHAAVAAVAASLLLATRRARDGERRRRATLVALACFAAHPVLADSVAWISGRSSMIAALGGVVGALLLARELARRDPRPIRVVLAAALGLLVGLLGKEDALVFGALYLVLAVRRGGGRRAAPAGSSLGRAGSLPGAVAGGIVLALLAYGGLRSVALGSPLPSAPHAPLADLSPWERLPYGGRAVLEALRLLVWPLDHPPTYRAAPGFTPDAAPGALALLGWGVIAVAVVVGLRALRRSRAGEAATPDPPAWTSADGALLGALALLPTLGLVPAGEVFAPRFLYTPLLLAVPLVASVLVRLPPFVGWLCVVLCVPLAWQRASVYADRGSYARAVLASVPSDARAWNDVGIAREEAGDDTGARAAWYEALAIDAAYGRPHSNLGRLALADGDVDLAIEHFRAATRLGVRNAIAYCNLGAALLARRAAGDLEEAGRAYADAASIAPGLAPAWRGLGNALLAAGEADEARAALERALELAPDDANARELLRRATEAGDADAPRGP